MAHADDARCVPLRRTAADATGVPGRRMNARGSALMGAATAIAGVLLTSACVSAGIGVDIEHRTSKVDISTNHFPPARTSSVPAALPLNNDTFTDVCTGTPVPNAAAYTGPGPHPVTFVDAPGQTYRFGGTFLGEPAAWQGDGEARVVQLVACVTTKSGPVVRTCSYGVIPDHPINLAIDRGRYTVVLYVAQTARKLATVTIEGSDIDCPPSLAFNPQEPSPHLPSDFTVAQMRAALGRYID